MTAASRILALPAIALLLAACGSDSDQVVFAIQAQSSTHSEWSEPVNLGMTINTTFNDQSPTLSADGLSLYFGSNRPRAGGSTDTDLWVSHRSCGECPWGTPVNLGPVVNSSVGDNGPSLSLDGHLLFFTLFADSCPRSSLLPGITPREFFIPLSTSSHEQVKHRDPRFSAS